MDISHTGIDLHAYQVFALDVVNVALGVRFLIPKLYTPERGRSERGSCIQARNLADDGAEVDVIAPEPGRPASRRWRAKFVGTAHGSTKAILTWTIRSEGRRNECVVIFFIVLPDSMTSAAVHHFTASNNTTTPVAKPLVGFEASSAPHQKQLLVEVATDGEAELLRTQFPGVYAPQSGTGSVEDVIEAARELGKQPSGTSGEGTDRVRSGRRSARLSRGGNTDSMRNPFSPC